MPEPYWHLAAAYPRDFEASQAPLELVEQILADCPIPGACFARVAVLSPTLGVRIAIVVITPEPTELEHEVITELEDALMSGEAILLTEASLAEIAAANAAQEPLWRAVHTQELVDA